MAEYREFGATNDPNTCLWCGRPLRPKREHVEPEKHGFSNTQYGTPEWKAFVKAQPIVGYGDYADGKFCGLRCGYLFGRRLADLGRRLKAKN